MSPLLMSNSSHQEISLMGLKQMQGLRQMQEQIINAGLCVCVCKLLGFTLIKGETFNIKITLMLL